MLPVKKILCPTDFSEPSFAALRTAEELALHFSAELTLIHVIPPVPVPSPFPDPLMASGFDVPLYQQELAVYSENTLKEVVAQRVSKEVACRIMVVTGDAAQQIIAGAAQETPDLIVIATHGQTGWRRLVFGSVAEKVVRWSSCPVLTIQAPRGEEQRGSV
jgi:universal stress protein A